jgi:hypothetical protein
MCPATAELPQDAAAASRPQTIAPRRNKKYRAARLFRCSKAAYPPIQWHRRSRETPQENSDQADPATCPHEFPQRHVLSIWPECHQHGKPAIGMGSIHVRTQDRAVSHRHVGILFQEHFMPSGHGSKPPITVMLRAALQKQLNRQLMTSSDTCARIPRPPLWLTTAFMDQFFQNIEAVAGRIGTVPLAWDFHTELRYNLSATREDNGRYKKLTRNDCGRQDGHKSLVSQSSYL